MSVGTFDPAVAVITVTEAARAHFKRELDRQGGGIVRLGVKHSGCTGMRYVVDIGDLPQASDTLIDLDEHVQIGITAEASPFVAGTEIDLVREGLNRQIVFNNPNVKDQCGCGESFSVK